MEVKYDENGISWLFDGERYNVELYNVIFASESNGLITITTGDNFITKKLYKYTPDCRLIFKTDKDKGLVEWETIGGYENILVDDLIQAEYYPNKSIVLVMSNSIDRNVFAIDVSKNEKRKVLSPEGFKMMFFQETNDEVYIVCDGDSSHTDKYGRNRVNFSLNLVTFELQKVGISY